ncbi:MAG: hypothetical protein MN733_34050 [Nitrososphaera sp.]|nr:hypothetical protein [Nitrososphaera sp.]
MDATKKTEIEKYVVLGLGGVFAVTFVMGPMRSLNFMGQGQPVSLPPLITEKVTLSGDLGNTLQKQWNDRLEPVNAQLPSDESAKAAPFYTAFSQRDPLKSLLPILSLQPGQTAASGVRGGAPQNLPPQLRIQGIVWGGAEPRAIINDAVYGVNDGIAGTKILSIDRRGVTVEYMGTSIFFAVSSMTP